MRKDIGFMSISTSEKGEAEKIFKFLKRAGCKLISLDKDLEKLTKEYVNNTKRPLLVLILGTSILKQDHFDQIKNVLKDKQFDSLDLLLQIVAGDGTIAFEVLNMIRSKVTGKLLCIAPGLLSGPGTLIALGSDLVLGVKDSFIMPLDIAHAHPAIHFWFLGKDEIHPAFEENKEEYERSYPKNIEYAKKVLHDADSERLIKYLTFQPDAKLLDFEFPKLIETGLKGHIPSGDDLIRLRAMQGIVQGALADFIYLIQ